jgi:hypothetical protein
VHPIGVGIESIETVLKSTVMMALYSIRSERARCEQLNHNVLFKKSSGKARSVRTTAAPPQPIRGPGCIGYDAREFVAEVAGRCSPRTSPRKRRRSARRRRPHNQTCGSRRQHANLQKDRETLRLDHDHRRHPPARMRATLADG